MATNRGTQEATFIVNIIPINGRVNIVAKLGYN